MAKLQHLLDIMDKRLLLQTVHDYVLIIKNGICQAQFQKVPKVNKVALIGENQ